MWHPDIRNIPAIAMTAVYYPWRFGSSRQPHIIAIAVIAALAAIIGRWNFQGLA